MIVRNFVLNPRTEVLLTELSKKYGKSYSKIVRDAIELYAQFSEVVEDGEREALADSS